MEMELPEGWRRVKIKEVGKAVTGSTPSTKNPAYWGGDIPFVTPADLLGEVIAKTARTITEEGALTARLLPAGTVLVSCIGHQIGKTALLENKAVTNQQINAIVPNKAVADGQFLLYVLTHARPGLSNLAAITTIPIINKSSFESFPFILPPLPEQRAIASVLGAAQAALAARRREQHLEQEHKAALLEELFTRGTHGEATRATEIGELPVGWGVGKLGKVVKLSSGSIRPANTISVADSANCIPVYGGNGIMGWTDVASSTQQHLIIGRVGAYCGCVCIADAPSWITDNALYSAKWLRHDYDIGFIANYLTFRNLNQYRRLGGQPLITQSILADIDIPLPPLPEQARIAAVLGALDAKLGALAGEVARLEELFRALLEELLSGRLRVGNLAAFGS